MKKNRQLKSTWLVEQFLEVFKARPHWPDVEIMECVRRAYKVLVKRDLVYKVKYAAHLLLHGSMKDHYKKVERYVDALKTLSPGIEVQLVTDPSKIPPVFQRLLPSLRGCNKGGEKGVERDGNDQMFPTAWVAVEGENNDSWEWFFTILAKVLELADGEGIAIISDEHIGTLDGVATALPKAEHRHCARHIFSHWPKGFRGVEMNLMYWKIAKAYNMADYEDACEQLNEINPYALIAFKSYNPKLFCREFLYTSVKSDAITSNMAETFNGYIIDVKTKNLLYMLDDIRMAWMQRMLIKKQEMEKSTSVICPRIQAKLEEEKVKAANCDVVPSTDTLFNVKYYLDQLTVDLEKRTCSCRKWDMLGIPCCHVIPYIFFQHKEAEDFVDECYIKSTYLKAYSGSIPPLDGERHWRRVASDFDPPPINIGPGRPRRNKIKCPFKDPKKPKKLSRHGMEMTCSLCQVKGHNKRRCPNKDNMRPFLEEPAAKRPRGGSRKDGGPTQSAPPPQPTQLGRGGRVIRGGQGARGSRGSRGGRGGRWGGGGGGEQKQLQGEGELQEEEEGEDMDKPEKGREVAEVAEVQGSNFNLQELTYLTDVKIVSVCSWTDPPVQLVAVKQPLTSVDFFASS
ncbi:uncharacterized protein [Spinacia oleracea]|uniref:SWIM-type domain-containing protein n=1 Tax=Spinacia oleracea TaxID=3562 RepID=A0ABM3QYV5_SPIOL|nr:uncharacterized protein LOC110800384 [Spinacia oleracea]